jgi:hypothetical protein
MGDGRRSSWDPLTVSEIAGVLKGHKSVVVFQSEGLLYDWKLRSWTPVEQTESNESKSYIPAISCPSVIIMEGL